MAMIDAMPAEGEVCDDDDQQNRADEHDAVVVVRGHVQARRRVIASLALGRRHRLPRRRDQHVARPPIGSGNDLALLDLRARRGRPPSRGRRRKSEPRTGSRVAQTGHQ